MTARLPSLNGLRAFEAAARHLSFTVAASELNVTQTAISHQIRRLEEELGIRLFIRQNRALALTPEARDYLPGVRAAFNDLRLATERLLRRENHHVNRPCRLQERRCRCRDPLWPRPLARPSRRLADGRRTVSGVQPCLAGGQETAAAPGRFGGPCAASLKRRQ